MTQRVLGPVLLGLLLVLPGPAFGQEARGDAREVAESGPPTGTLAEIVSRRASRWEGARTSHEALYQSVASALRALGDAQGENGAWSSDAWQEHDTGLTAMAVLSFTSVGIGLEHDEYGAVVQRATRYLVDGQRSDGLFMTGVTREEATRERAEGEATRTTTDRPLGLNGVMDLYDHAFATTALAEVHALSTDDELLAPLGKACTWSERRRDPYLAWSYKPALPFANAGHSGSTALSSWMLLSTWTAKRAGVELDLTQPCKGVYGWWIRWTEPSTGRVPADVLKVRREELELETRWDWSQEMDFGGAKLGHGDDERFLLGGRTKHGPTAMAVAVQHLRRIPPSSVREAYETMRRQGTGLVQDALETSAEALGACPRDLFWVSMVLHLAGPDDASARLKPALDALRSDQLEDGLFPAQSTDAQAKGDLAQTAYAVLALTSAWRY